MQQWQVLIADDEPLGRARLARALKQMPGVTLVGEAGDGAAAADLIVDLQPDIVLLDMQMPNLNGLEVCAIPSAEPNRRAFIFVTAFEQFARPAFDVAAIDYLLKPFSIERLKVALRRAITHCERAELESRYRESRASDDLWVTDRQGTRRIRIDAIDWIAAEGDYSRIHVGPEQVLHGQSLRSLEGKLEALGFARVHRSALVRLAAVQRIDRAGGGQIALVTGSPIPAPVGRRSISKVRRYLKKSPSSTE